MEYNEKEEMRLILGHFGHQDQIIKFAEECSEATTEILKWMCSSRDKEKVWESIKYEVADVYNVLGQMIEIIGEEEIKQIASSKRTLCIRHYINPYYIAPNAPKNKN